MTSALYSLRGKIYRHKAVSTLIAWLLRCLTFSTVTSTFTVPKLHHWSDMNQRDKLKVLEHLGRRTFHRKPSGCTALCNLRQINAKHVFRQVGSISALPQCNLRRWIVWLDLPWFPYWGCPCLLHQCDAQTNAELRSGSPNNQKPVLVNSDWYPI